MSSFRLRRISAAAVVAVVALVCCSFSSSAAWAATSLYEQAEEASFHQDYDSAIDLYKRSIKDEPDHAGNSATRLFRLYSRLHRYDDAAEFLHDVVRLTGDEHYNLELADLMRDAGKHYEAQRLYHEQLAQHPDDPDALFGLGCSLEATGNYDDAREFLTRAVTAGGGKYSEVARQHLGRLVNASHTATIDADQEIGRWPASAMPLKVYIEDGSKVQGYQAQLRGFVIDAITQWSQAAHELVSLQEVREPENANITVSWAARLGDALGITYPTVSGHSLRKVRMELATNMDQSGHPLPPLTQATRELYEARDRMVREVALHEFGHALGLDHSPRTDDIMADGIFGLNSKDVVAARSLQTGDVDRLRALYTAPGDPSAPPKQAVASGGSEPAVILQTNKNVAAGKRDGAGGTSVRSPVSAAPVSANDAAIKDAMFQLSAGNYQAATDMLQTMINRDPGSARAHYLMAITLVNKRDYEGAVRQYQEVLRLAPGGKLAQMATAGLSKLKN